MARHPVVVYRLDNDEDVSEAMAHPFQAVYRSGNDLDIDDDESCESSGSDVTNVVAKDANSDDDLRDSATSSSSVAMASSQVSTRTENFSSLSCSNSPGTRGPLGERRKSVLPPLDKATLIKIHLDVEACIRQGITKEDTCHILAKCRGYHILAVRLVWAGLEKQNPEFFQKYVPISRNKARE